MKLEQYRTKLVRQLDNLSTSMKPGDMKQVQDNILEAASYPELDSISLGLNFHKFRVDEQGN